ncbi:MULTISPECIES: hypothetical protein [Streptococcus]|uniref:hypothetical protein n=1 Tax=Streptococcus TaxID=1301 RepID=UPI0005E7C476|nr:hypothetical protein [Streptococcus agalactiae]CNC26284.1 Uncharacterised protein [Streptococcus agalactiae]
MKNQKPLTSQEISDNKLPKNNKKGRYPFSLHYDVRYQKLEELVKFHGSKSASDYLENLIIKEWSKMQRKLKTKK